MADIGSKLKRFRNKPCFSASERKRRRKVYVNRRVRRQVYIGTAIDRWNDTKKILGPWSTDRASQGLPVHLNDFVIWFGDTTSTTIVRTSFLTR